MYFCAALMHLRLPPQAPQADVAFASATVLRTSLWLSRACAAQMPTIRTQLYPIATHYCGRLPIPVPPWQSLILATLVCNQFRRRLQISPINTSGPFALLKRCHTEL